MLWPGRHIGWKETFKRIAGGWSEDAVPTAAAALTFYGVLSIFPFLIAVVAIAALFLDPASIANLSDQLRSVAPAQVAQLLTDRLRSLSQSNNTTLLTVGFVVAIWTASRGVVALIEVLNGAYDVRETRPWWKRQLLAIGVTLAAGVVTVVGAAVMFGLPIVAHWLGRWAVLLTIARFIGSAVAMMLLWALLYRFLPNVKPRKLQLITPGAVVGVSIWLLASWGFGKYVAHFGRYEATYGALGAVVVLLTWMWISSMVILAGAEINKVLMPAEDKRKVTTRDDRQVRTPTGAEPQPV